MRKARLKIKSSPSWQTDPTRERAKFKFQRNRPTFKNPQGVKLEEGKKKAGMEADEVNKLEKNEGDAQNSIHKEGRLVRHMT